MSKKRILVFVGGRANYSSIKSVMLAVKKHPDLELQTVVGTSAVLERFGKVEDLIVNDGFNINARFYNLIEGESPVTMAKSTGLGLIEASSILDNLKPDFVVIVGDRFEMMSVVIAAAYQNIRIAHTMGGEVTGTIDESIRHAITKFAHVHFPANDDALKRILKMGESEEFVFNVGCPRTDLVKKELENDSLEVLKTLFKDNGGVGNEIDLCKPFLLVSQHPVTTEFGCNRMQIEQTLQALNRLEIPTIMLWPNADAGGDDISKGIRTFREKHKPDWLHVFKNLPTNQYIHLMANTACLIGNSSSGIREGAFIGTPVVNIGTRQNMRMRGDNVFQVGYNSQEILDAIVKQVEHGRYECSHIYGDGKAGEKIADTLANIEPSIQKTIVY
ncbi:UDP-N-acetylglucosamine 2-epimerase (hydrolyzing) [Salinivibrio kushneri]|uniref:UDP-N-acetylglucosamine 2-epimerase n=1 Tax=Salinivibrio kushneri TaxID=1908198 RepID=UPI000988C167|nr:UDP-N-acetylglucosamine 2-epimerase [Salinivibrio kushneri]OOE31977.1 UDP-N-acetylglucosamine 2-epimerase (hydrolyzing) [Salinivibrio kushneri]